MVRIRHPMNALFDRIEAGLHGFLASRAVLFRWLVKPEELPWIETKLKKGPAGVRWMELTTAFEHPAAHGYALGRELLRKGSGGPEPWRPPALPSGMDDAVALAMMAESLAQHACEGKQLLLELAPVSVVEPVGYLRWVQRCVRVFERTRVRLLVLEDVTSRPLDPLARERAVCSMPARLGVDEAVEAVAEVEAKKKPEETIRLVLLRCMHACRRGELEQAGPLANEAVMLAEGLGKPELGVPARFAIGGTYLGQGRHLDAVKAYRDAEALAVRAEDAGHPEGTKLRVYARMAVGAALLGGQGYEAAGTYLLETAPLAAKIPDLRLEVESYRLAAYGFERAGQPRAAWDAGLRGFGVVSGAAPEERPMDAARELGRSLVRLTETRELRHYRGTIAHELDRQLGPGWAEGPRGVKA